MSESDWAQRRREAADVHADRLAQRRQAEHDQAGRLLREFAQVAARHLPAQPLQVRAYGGRGTVRSNVSGWYLRGDRAAGVSTSGEFYVLTAPIGLRERVLGVRLAPSAPPLVLGAGGKDGESLDLPVALERVLPGWRDLV